MDRDSKEESDFMEGDLGEKDIMEPIAGKLVTGGSRNASYRRMKVQ